MCCQHWRSTPLLTTARLITPALDTLKATHTLHRPSLLVPLLVILFSQVICQDQLLVQLTRDGPSPKTAFWAQAEVARLCEDERELLLHQWSRGETQDRGDIQHSSTQARVITQQPPQCPGG